jgi:GT2 family glycosyltransferase
VTRPEAPPRASVIVMTVDRPGPLRRCLESLAAQSLPADVFEVILVDGSADPAADLVAEFAGRLQITHHPGPNLGVAGNRNTGVALARGPVVGFLDDDCVADPPWLELLTLAVEAHPRSLIGGLVENPYPKNAVAVAGQVITEGVHDFFNPSEEEPRFFPGLNFAVDRETYLAIGGCDTTFGRLAAEDRDFADRWRIAGGKLVSCPGAVVHHEHRATLSGFVRQHVNYGRGAWRYHRVRRLRRSGRMTDDLRLHSNLHRHLGPPVMRQVPGMRAKVICLLAAWQLANLVGFVSQGVIEATARHIPRDDPSRH